MACDASLGRLEPCKDAIGGIKTIYFVNFGDAPYVDFVFSGDGELTDAGTPSANAYQYDLRGTGNTFDETNENSRDNGTSIWTQLGTVVLKKQDIVSQKELKLLSAGRPQVIVEYYTGDFKIAGGEHGCEVVVNTASGGAMSDLNGYNITFTGIEKEPAPFVDAAIIGAGLDFIPIVGV